MRQELKTAQQAIDELKVVERRYKENMEYINYYHATKYHDHPEEAKRIFENVVKENNYLAHRRGELESTIDYYL